MATVLYFLSKLRKFSQIFADLFTASADKSLAAIDLSTGKILFQKMNAHKYLADCHCLQIYKSNLICISSHPLLCAATREHFLATGDEEGGVKLWDLRQSKELFSWQENDDFISELLLSPENNALLATRYSPDTQFAHRRADMQPS